jgi:hypothetical protein
MPSKPRTLAGILHPRRHADAEYNRARRSGPDRSVEDAVVSSARWKARSPPRPWCASSWPFIVVGERCA